MRTKSGPLKTLSWHYGALFLAFGFLLVLPYLFGHWRLADDAYMQYIPTWLFQERILSIDHEWVQWILNTGMGEPAGLSLGASWYYPPQVIWGQVIGWSELSYLYYLALHLSLGAWFAWRLARRLALTEAASVFFALAFAGNGYVIGLFSNPILIFPYLYWPLLVSGLIDVQSAESAASLRASIRKIAVATLLIELSGYGLTKLILFAATFGSYWVMAKKPGRWFEGVRWKPVALALGVAVIAASPEWITTFQAVKYIDRLHSDIYDQYTYANPTNFYTFATMILPNLFLQRDSNQIGIAWLERSWWVGSLTIAMIWVGLRNGLLSLRRFQVPMIAAILALLYAMGGHSLFRELIAVLLPPFRFMRHSNNARFVTMGFLAFLGAHGLSALETKFPDGAKKSEPRKIARPWFAFMALVVIFAVSEYAYVGPARDLYLDVASGWKIGLLHVAFFLLLAYTAFMQKFVLLDRWKWPAIVVALQFLTLVDAAYGFRHVIAKEEPLHVEAAFQVASPQPNERSLHGWLDGDDWITWHGNKKVLYGYNEPEHHFLSAAVNNEKTKPFLGSLASCVERPAEALGFEPSGPHSCEGFRFVIDRHFGNHILVHVQNAQPAYLMIHDFIDPNWRALINGQPAKILTGYDMFKVVELPTAGDWKVEFEYVHPLFPLLWWVAALGIALIVVMPPRLVETVSGGAFKKRARRRAGAGAATTPSEGRSRSGG